MIKVAVTGAAGRMGSGIIRKISQQDDMEVVAAIEIPNTPLEGKMLEFKLELVKWALKLLDLKIWKKH